MPLRFDYICDNCFKESDNEHMDSMVCKCGGTMRVNRGIQGVAFQSFYSKELGEFITSHKQEDRLMKEKGLSYMSDYKKSVHKVNQFRRHKEDLNYEAYAKEGLKYPKGHNVRFDEKRGEFIKPNGERFKKTVFFSIAFFLLSLVFSLTTAFARIEGIEYVELKINGKLYNVPIGNIERKNEIYYLKKALNGDKEARDIFLGGGHTKWFYIGEETPLWLKITKNKEEVIKP